MPKQPKQVELAKEYDAQPLLAIHQIKNIVEDARNLSCEEWSDKYDPAGMGYSIDDLMMMYLDGYASHKSKKWFNNLAEKVDGVLQKYCPEDLLDEDPRLQLGSKIALLMMQFRRKL